MKIIQELYINLDDSGKLTKKEKISVYGGIIFLSKQEKDKFITQYRSIIKDIRCKYCKNKCNNKCPEIKNHNILPKDKRRLMNYLKKYYVVGLIIKNNNIYEHIKIDKGARGRFLDYSMRRMIKELIKGFIKNKTINPNQKIKLIINIDEQTTKDSGYYNLKDGLFEELKYGIANYNYGAIFNPIIFSDLSIVLKYQNSSNSYVVQAADLIAGTIRRISLTSLDNNTLDENLAKLLDFKIIFP